MQYNQLSRVIFAFDRFVSFGCRIYRDQAQTQAADLVEQAVQGGLVGQVAGEHGGATFFVGGSSAGAVSARHEQCG